MLRFIYTVELEYNDLSLDDTSAVVLHILWHQLTPHKACTFLPCLLLYIRASSSDVMTLPVISVNRIFQEVGSL